MPTEAKRRVAEVSAALFAEKGIEGVSMRDIAAKLGIRAPSIYSHYASKSALVNACIDPYLADARRLGQLSSDFLDLRGYLRAYADLLDKERNAAVIVHGDPTLREAGFVPELVTGLVARGVPEPVAGALLVMLRAPWLTPGPVSQVEVTSIVEFILGRRYEIARVG